VDVIGGIVRDRQRPTEKEIRTRAEAVVDARDVEKFVDLAIREFARLYEGNIARYRIRPSEFWAWFRALQGDPA
jgi:hypothetical protein